jgi:soluble lytic murein transglycosylase-like protein
MSNMRGLRGALVLLAACSLPALARADIYRYIDAEGVEHYTNIQPQGHGWQRILRTSSPVAARGLRSASGASLSAPDPDRTRRYDAHIREAALLYVLPEEFIRAVMHVESNFYSEAVSNKGAMGLMQLMPGTASAMGVLNPFDARQNVLGGARYLRVLANRFSGDLVLTIAAYNAGEGAVERYNGIPPFAETRHYVQRVLTDYYAYRASQLLGPRGALARK